MSFKVAVIGAGSITFTRNLMRDLLSVPEFRSIRIGFTDINETNLERVRQLVQRDIDANGLDIKVEASTDRREILRNSRYVFNLVRIGGLEAFAKDIEIPLKYGIDRCMATPSAPAVSCTLSVVFQSCWNSAEHQRSGRTRMHPAQLR